MEMEVGVVGVVGVLGVGVVGWVGAGVVGVVGSGPTVYISASRPSACVVMLPAPSA